jgi:hypothetical protein
MPFSPGLIANRWKAAPGAHGRTYPPFHSLYRQLLADSSTKLWHAHKESWYAHRERDDVRYFFQIPSTRPVAAAWVNFCLEGLIRPKDRQGSGYAAESEESQGVKSVKGGRTEGVRYFFRQRPGARVAAGSLGIDD